MLGSSLVITLHVIRIRLQTIARSEGIKPFLSASRGSAQLEAVEQKGTIACRPLGHSFYASLMVRLPFLVPAVMDNCFSFCRNSSVCPRDCLRSEWLAK